MKNGWILATCFVAFNVNAAAKPEHNPLAPRVPPDKIAAAKALKSPVPGTPENIAAGQVMFTTSSTCWTCHGKGGKGDGPAGLATAVGPRNFTTKEFHTARTCGEMFWVAANGTHGDFSKAGAPSHPDGSGMVSYLKGHTSELGLRTTPSVASEEDLWKIVLFERSLGGNVDCN
ncbi:MAG: hypothetical protein FD165_2731 [Gammaproteobacteria bacterium]|nr:MAG: hypothetical protein FD165_2731 [Gammaproteobacteria bacterium]TND01415.1 MAG: hypothetical protein FD120_2588 [Gammaproteobacteria bacterium]